MLRIIKSVYGATTIKETIRKYKSVDGQLELSRSAGGSAGCCHHSVMLFATTF